MAGYKAGNGKTFIDGHEAEHGKRIRIPQYSIHILSVTAVSAEAFDLPPERNALISCTGRVTPSLKRCGQNHILILPFPDVEDPQYAGAFGGAHARAILRFLEELPETVTDLYVCCSKGGSRSPAVAAALLRISGRSDREVWENPYYVPNTLVYYCLCREAGIPISWEDVWRRKQKNDEAFRNVQNGEPCRYERWQILE